MSFNGIKNSLQFFYHLYHKFELQLLYFMSYHIAFYHLYCQSIWSYVASKGSTVVE
jgi:hypothetical protein